MCYEEENNNELDTIQGKNSAIGLQPIMINSFKMIYMVATISPAFG